MEGDFYIGSADWMYRNLTNRFEVIAPINNAKNKKKLWHVLRVNQEDFSTSWELKNNGTYVLRSSKMPKAKRLSTATHSRLILEA